MQAVTPVAPICLKLSTPKERKSALTVLAVSASVLDSSGFAWNCLRQLKADADNSIIFYILQIASPLVAVGAFSFNCWLISAIFFLFSL